MVWDILFTRTCSVPDFNGEMEGSRRYIPIKYGTYD
jgi:hypothetical protein